MTSGLPAPATLFPHPVFRDNQCIPGSAAISSLQSAPRQIQSASATISAIQSAPRQIHSASATISAPPVRVATNTFRLRNYFRHSSLRRDKYSPPPQLFPQFSPRRDKYSPPPQLFPSLQSAPRQIRSASATISAPPVRVATNTVRLRNHFRNSVRAATNTFRLRDHFRNSVRAATNTFRLRNYFRNSAHKFSCSSEIIQHQLHTLFPNLLPYQHIPRTAVINHHTSPPFSPSLSSL